jgi:membrane-associated phospholipid phosphatase
MPSLHFGWILLVGISTFLIAKTIWLKVVGVLVPLCMLIATIATGNHFIIDLIAGAIVIGLAYGVVILFTRLRSKVKPPLALEKHGEASK